MNRPKLPKTFQHAAKDVPAGFVVFLVALPLCLGIALASDAPMASGIITGIVAGLVVSWVSDSHISVSGPAAGLTVTVAAAIQRLGSFNGLLVSVFLAGLIQILFGLVRAGVLASFFPHSVIKGMLAAIGLIIILKQIPHALGWDADFVGDEQYIQARDQETTFSEILKAFDRMEPGAIAASVIAVLAIVIWSGGFVKRNRRLSFVPAPLVAVVAGTLTSVLWGRFFPDYALTAADGHLVAIPTSGGARGLIASLPAPDWSFISKSATWEIAIALALIASIESLLTLEASDRLDPERRVSDSNRELLAQGVGNVICGLIGGLPMTGVIVRSSANVYAGAKTRLSAFVHGVCLLCAVAVIPGLLNVIPLAALAVVLISVGLKLFSWKVLKDVWRSGFEQALPFAVTVIAIVATDLLTGVAVGLVVGLMIVIRMNHQSAITVVSEGDTYLVRFAKDVSFAHKPAFKKILWRIPEGTDVIIDGTGAHFIDHDILETVSDFYEGSGQRNMRVTLKNLRTKRMSRWGGVLHGKLQEPSIGQ
jgi:MFS superfamily sulfate permease-like transporter